MIRRFTDIDIGIDTKGRGCSKIVNRIMARREGGSGSISGSLKCGIQDNRKKYETKQVRAILSWSRHRGV